jgi:endosialidase-like protein
MASSRAGGGGGGARASAGARGGARGGGGGGRGGGGRRSDIRLKHDIVLLGYLRNGIGLYRFRYNDNPKLYVGVLAQQVQTIAPQAVTRGTDGYFRVYYRDLGIRFQTYRHWVATVGRLRDGTVCGLDTCPAAQ